MPVKVSFSDLEDAVLFAGETRHFWLDKRTGRILSYSDEAASAVEEGDLDDLPDWMQEEVEAATEVLGAFGELPPQQEQKSVAPDAAPVDDSLSADGSLPASENEEIEVSHGNGAVELGRYVSIEQIPSHEAFRFMEDFIDALSSSVARDALIQALRGNHPFRRFKEALQDFPKERERWFEYEATRRSEYIEEWARDQGVELDFSKNV